MGVQQTELRRRTPDAEARPRQAQAVSGPRFEWTMVVLLSWFVGGLYWDGWAHQHVPELETFFTFWHAVLYSGYLAAAALVFGATVRNRQRGYSWRRAVPRGYELTLVGAGLFAIGGVGDLLWHELFGIEQDVEALLSPTHLLLAFGMGLMLTGPLRSAWRRPYEGARQPAAAVSLWPMVLSLALMLSLLSFFTLYAHPFARPWAAAGNRPAVPVFALVAPWPDLPIHPQGGIESDNIAQSLGVGDVLVQTALLMGLVLLAVRRWNADLPFGSVTAILAVSALLMGLMRDLLFVAPVAFVAGLVADGLLRALRPAAARPVQLRLFAAAVPVVLYALYFLAVQAIQGIWWTVHLWAGAVVLAGLVGWLLSYVLVPPPFPGEEPHG